MSRAVRQSIDRILQVLEVTIVANRLGGGRYVRHGLHAILLTTLLAHSSQYRVDRDPVHPGTESAVAAKPRKLFPGLDKRFLRTVLSLTGVAGHPQAKPIDPTDMQPVERFEGRHIRLPGARYPALLVKQALLGHCRHRVTSGCRGCLKRFQSLNLPMLYYFDTDAAPMV
jgi:hypothetical protein